MAEIGPGLLVFLGIEKNDSERQAARMVERLLGYRVFDDAAGKMNLNVSEVAAELLLVPQFTLAADTDTGLRPGFSSAAPPDQAHALFEQVVDIMGRQHGEVKIGQFGADMAVHLINDGPVTFLLKT